MSRAQWTLVGLLGLQLLLLVLLRAPFARAGDAAGSRALLPALESITPARIEISAAGEDAGTVTLARGEDGWAVESAGGYPADRGQVDKLLDELRGVVVRRPVVTSARYHRALEVGSDKHQRRVRIWGDPAEDPDVDLLIGNSPNYRVTHVRRADEQRVYEAQLSQYDIRAEADAWVDKKFFDLPFDRVTRLAVKNRHGAIEVERVDGAWRAVGALPAGRALDDDKVDSWVRSLVSLWLSEPAGPVDPAAQGFDEPAATLEVHQRAADAPPPGEDAEAESTAEEQPADAAGEVEVTRLTIGAEAEPGTGKRYATRSGFGFAAVLGKFDADKAVEKKLSDLLADAG